MSYNTQDRTASNPAYFVPNLKKRVLTSNQRIPLEHCAYADTLKLTMEGTVVTPLVKGID